MKISFFIMILFCACYREPPTYTMLKDVQNFEIHRLQEIKTCRYGRVKNTYRVKMYTTQGERVYEKYFNRELQDKGIFNLMEEAQCQKFLQKAFQMREIESSDFDRDTYTIVIDTAVYRIIDTQMELYEVFNEVWDEENFNVQEK